MRSVLHGISSTEAIEGLLVLLKCAEPILDVTWGNGNFWVDSPRRVWGADREFSRCKHLCCDFHHLPFAGASIPTVIYDPPFHPEGAKSAEALRFRTMGWTEKSLKSKFQEGLTECIRVSSDMLIVKCQGFIHNHKPQWMPLWATEILGEPYEWLIVSRDHKRESGRWVSNNSLRRNHADYLVFRHRGNHR